jgi:predicted ArsR family transcriptional regulator
MLRRLEQDADRVGALGDDLRRALYLYVRAEGRPVTREEAAAAVGISRKLAAFHLDKLVERGLLAHAGAPTAGRVGRPAKRYEPSRLEIEVSIPERRYDVLGSIFLEAITTQAPDESGVDAANRAAGAAGRRLGEEERDRQGLGRPGSERALSASIDALDRVGFEPYRDDEGCVRLRSCPFHALAERDRDVVCGMNHRFVEGVVRGLGNRSVAVVPEPVEGRCCVKLEPAPGGAR